MSNHSMSASQNCLALASMLDGLKTSTLLNYVTPGLSSSLLEKGTFRLFESSRHTEYFITPHSHRFGFFCIVLKGYVVNTIYERVEENLKDDLMVDPYQVTYLEQAEPDSFQYLLESDTATKSPTYYRRVTTTYAQGQCYSMEYHQIHSIQFSKGAVVLFIEGPDVINISTILQPFVGGKEVPTFAREPWMFLKKDV